MPASTTKYALPYPVDTDPNNPDGDIQTLAAALDGLIGTFSAATARPSAGKAGRWHLQPTGGSGTPPTNTLSYDDGTAWRAIGVLDPTTGLLAPSLSGPAAISTYTETLVDLGSMGASKAIDLSLGNEFKGTLTANCTVSFTNVPSAAAKRLSVTLRLTQDATGSRTVTWPASVNWGAAGAPTLTTTATKSDVLSFLSDDAGTTWYGFSAGGGF